MCHGVVVAGGGGGGGGNTEAEDASFSAHGWVDDLQCNVLFNSISFIRGGDWGRG